jgi:O-antigen ligase
VAWGINAVMFPGLAAAYEASLLVGRGRHPVGVRHLVVPAGLFAAVVVWIWLQIATWPAAMAHPIWAMASDALDRPLAGSISVNRDLTMLALVRLLTAASVFWVALQLCRDARRAVALIKSVAAIACLYAVWGLIDFALKAGRLPWLEGPSASGYLSSTFINRNSFATYAGVGLVAICGLIVRLYRREGTIVEGPARVRIASFIEITGQRGAALLGGAFLILVALLLTGSRGGIIATGLGLLVLAAVSFRPRRERSAEQFAMITIGMLLVGAAFLTFGDLFVATLSTRGLADTDRLAVYLITLRSIVDAPVLGFGYGTFADVFPMYRDHSISAQGVWEQAHNTYLEVFQGLGLMFGSMLLASVVVLVGHCIQGATARLEGATVPRVAAGVAVLVGVHALVDFSLQIQAVALTFIAVLGAGVAQSTSSRLALND